MEVKNQNILITGGAGFVGANFVYKFLELGYKISIIEGRKTSLWRLKGIKNKININYIDLKNYLDVEKFITKLNPQIILHFAAYGTYPRKQKDIRKIIDTNLLGTMNLVNACSKTKFKCFINTGSSSEYGIKEKPMKETDLLEPDNLYGITKAAATNYCQFTANRLNLPIITMRLFGVYGYFEEKERLIPTVIKSFLTNTELKLSSPKSVRDYIFIEDIVEAYLKAIKNIQKVKGEIFNLGTGKQYSINEVVKTVKEITGSKIKPEYGKIKLGQTEPKNWLADISKIKRLLNWQSKNNLKGGLQKNIDWFKENMFLYR